MVFFVCNHCGEAIKKPKVPNHFFKCRNPADLSCQDCGKDFKGESWKSHNSCVSEAQKYGGVDYVEKGSSNKNLKKQNVWLDYFREAIRTAQVSSRARQYLERISECENIPRKEAKFNNFVGNICRTNDPRILKEMWSVFETAKNQQAQTNVQNGSKEESNGNGDAEKPSENNQSKKEAVVTTSQDPQAKSRKNKSKSRDEEMNASNGNTADEGEATAKKKAKTGHHDVDTQDQDATMNGTLDSEVSSSTTADGGFNWKKYIKKALKNADGNQLNYLEFCQNLKEEYTRKTSDDIEDQDWQTKVLARLLRHSDKFELIVRPHNDGQ